MKVRHIGPGRWKVTSETDPLIEYLVKWYEEEKRFTCDCPFGNLGTDRLQKYCKHVNEILRRVQAGEYCLGEVVKVIDPQDLLDQLPKELMPWEVRCTAIYSKYLLRVQCDRHGEHKTHVGHYSPRRGAIETVSWT